MSRRPPTDPLRALSSPDATLDELREAHPELWEEVSASILAALGKGTPEASVELMQRVRAEADAWGQRVRASKGNPKVSQAALPHLLRARMTRLALGRCYHAAAAAQPGGTLRFSLLNGTLVQKLLFRQGLERKPASLKQFRFWWRFVTQKRILMPLVQERGIYCFYTQELIAELKELCAGRPCLEIAAGDGTLSRFLRQAGVEATATDNRAWTRAITYPEDVENLDARGALSRHSPSVVLCSWPPPGNTFEKHVLATRSVQLYVVIGSRHRFASGSWEAYEQQT
ncbi:MAG: SAM-dependent methyltransferase, partial [Deltaproteobacteria bacterium]|nr:SAM-dependent methyltransferase [Deltaproteobacteria bacterium]